MRPRIDETLLENKTFVAYFSNGCLHFVFVSGVHLRQKVGINMHYDNGMSFCKRRAYVLKIVKLSRIVVLKINAVVDMSELIAVDKTKLHGHGMMVFYVFKWYVHDLIS